MEGFKELGQAMRLQFSRHLRHRPVPDNIVSLLSPDLILFVNEQIKFKGKRNIKVGNGKLNEEKQNEHWNDSCNFAGACACGCDSDLGSQQ